MDKHSNPAVAAGHSLNAAGWRRVSALVIDRFAGRFARVETRRAAAEFVTGLLSDLEVKTSWQLAEHAGHDRPDAMQRLLYRAKWDADAVRDDVRQVVIDRLGDPDGVLVVDETGDLKKGVHSVGVQRQYTGTAGRIENAQVSVFLAYASRHGHTLIDRRIYLPESWTSNRERREQAAIPATIAFATRSQLADDMITATLQTGTPARWVTADEAYGNNTALRARLRRLRLGYVLAISRDHLIGIDGGKTRQRADHLADGLPTWAWTRRSAGAGSKGPRLYDWAWLTDVGTDGDPTGPHDGWHSLLIRRNYTTGELAFYRCWTPEPAGLARLVHVAGTRWIVEVGFQTAKGQVGLDQHQVRQWHSWHRFTTLALAALAILAICAADTNQDHTPPDTPRLSINEIRRLINILIPHPTGNTTHRLRWSNWRLHHQARAKRAHYARRLSLEFQP